MASRRRAPCCGCFEFVFEGALVAAQRDCRDRHRGSGNPQRDRTRCTDRQVFTENHLTQKHGYHRRATVPDFYAPGDDKIVYIKNLAPPAPHQ